MKRLSLQKAKGFLAGVLEEEEEREEGHTSLDVDEGQAIWEQAVKILRPSLQGMGSYRGGADGKSGEATVHMEDFMDKIRAIPGVKSAKLNLDRNELLTLTLRFEKKLNP